MVCSELAVTLQCLGKLYSRTVYSGKQRNIYEHIYNFIPQFTSNPPVQKHFDPEKHSRKNLYTGPEKISRKYTGDKNFLAPLNPQFREHMYN